MRWPYQSDNLRPYEWRCRNCGCIESGERCWQCDADEDGNVADERAERS